MEETEIIRKIQKFKEIKPRKEWVLLTKEQIFGLKAQKIRWFETLPRLTFQLRPAFVIPAILVLLIVGFTLNLARFSLPGDFLFPVKKATEKIQTNLTPAEEKSKIHLELVNKRLEELNKIAEENLVKNLAPAISEFQANVSQAAKNLSKIEKIKEKPEIIKEVAFQAKKIEENKEKVEALGVVVGQTEELDDALAELVEREIGELEKKTLTQEQQELLKEAKEDFQAGNYSQALEKILLLSYPQE